MATCNCMGPQNGEPLCPCQMRSVREYEGKRWPVYVQSHTQGCVCPPGSEATCQGSFCPRQPLRPLSSATA